MRLYRNLREIRRKENLGRRLSLIGLGVLFIGLLFSFVPTWYPPETPPEGGIARFLWANWVWISFAALPIGFIFASVGSYYINRFARRRWPGIKTIARPDELLERSLKGFDDKYAFFAWSLPANYVVAGPCGILILAPRSDRGKVIVQGDRWREPFGIGRLLTVFAREGVGNPTVELEEQEKKMRALLRSASTSTSTSTSTNGGANGEGSLADVPIEGAAVFLNPQMQLTLDNPSVPTLRSDQVKEYIRRRAKDVRLQQNTVRELTNFLAQHSVYQEPKDPTPTT